jgi:hypothetical protein
MSFHLKYKFDSPIHTTRVHVYLKKGRFLYVFLNKMSDFKTCALNQMSLLTSYFEKNNRRIIFSFLFDQKRLIKGIKHDFLKRPLKRRIFTL